MEQIQLNVEKREQSGKGPSRRLRQAGKIPAVLYGLGQKDNLVLNPATITGYLLKEGGQNQILTLSGTGLNGKNVLIKEFQIDPVSRKLLHVDLLEIDIKKRVMVTVPLNYTGKSVGVAEGGVLNIVERDIKVRCLPTQIPKHIDIDVTSLKIADSIHLNALTLPEGIESVIHQNLTLVTVVPPTKEEELQPALQQAQEPEVITEKKEAKAEGEEGEKTTPTDDKDASKAKDKKEEKKK